MNWRTPESQNETKLNEKLTLKKIFKNKKGRFQNSCEKKKELFSMSTEKTVEILNNLITQAIWNGADLGGSYNQNGEKLTESIEKAIEYFGLNGYTVGKIE